MRKTAVSALGILTLWIAAQQAQACLRPELDERAIQWSSLIVKANLVSTKPYGEPKEGQLGLVVSTWKVTQVFDGSTKVDAEIAVLTFPNPSVDAPADPCSVLPQPGKSMILLLRPTKDCAFDVRPDAKTVPGEPFVMVSRLTEEDATDEAVKDLQHRIAEVRSAEAKFNEKEAQFQAVTLANAVDDIEVDHADSALLEMGPKAIPAMKEVLEKTPGNGKKRLQRIIDELSPPSADSGKKKEG